MECATVCIFGTYTASKMNIIPYWKTCHPPHHQEQVQVTENFEELLCLNLNFYQRGESLYLSVKSLNFMATHSFHIASQYQNFSTKQYSPSVGNGSWRTIHKAKPAYLGHDLLLAVSKRVRGFMWPRLVTGYIILVTSQTSLRWVKARIVMMLSSQKGSKMTSSKKM